MAEEQSDVDKLKAAFRAWNDTKGASIDTWLDLMADQIDWRSLADGARAVAWTTRGKTRAEVRAYLIALTSAFAMEHYTVEQYVCDADTIVTGTIYLTKHIPYIWYIGDNTRIGIQDVAFALSSI